MVPLEKGPLSFREMILLLIHALPSNLLFSSAVTQIFTFPNLHLYLTMNVSRAEFNSFVSKQDRRHAEIMAHLQKMSQSIERQHVQSASGTMTESVYEKFHGTIANPAAGRNSQKTSFVNVGASLKSGIDGYNATVEDENKIIISDFDVPLRSWTHSAMDITRTIVAKHPKLNDALGKTSIQGAKMFPYFRDNPQKYNREVSAIVTELKQVLPVLNLASGNWAPRQLLRNVFQNARAKRSSQAHGKTPDQEGRAKKQKSHNTSNSRCKSAKTTRTQPAERILDEVEDFSSSDAEEVSVRRKSRPSSTQTVKHRSSKTMKPRKKTKTREMLHTSGASRKRFRKQDETFGDKRGEKRVKASNENDVDESDSDTLTDSLST